VIRYYDSSGGNKKFFTATCECGHGKCILTRQATVGKSSSMTTNIRAKGRPLGQMVAWLAYGTCSACKDKNCHWDKVAMAEHVTFERRVAARLSLSTMPSVTEILAAERPKRASEDDEPEGLA